MIIFGLLMILYFCLSAYFAYTVFAGEDDEE